MRVNFPDSGIIDAVANRLYKYIKNNCSDKLNREQASNLASKCYGYLSYKNFKSNQSAEEPQFKSLSQAQISELKLQQIKELSFYFNISEKEGVKLWKALAPAEFLRGHQRLKIDQIGFYCYDWGRPDEYGEDTDEIKVKNFVIGVLCPTCNGKGKHETWEQDVMDQPPIMSYDVCDNCDGTGVSHHTDNDLNKIRLSEKEFQLKVEHDNYFDDLDDEFNSNRYASTHYSEALLYDEDNPDAYSSDWPDDNDDEE